MLPTRHPRLHQPEKIRPIVIKRITRDAPPPRQAQSWKVAYADFVTAMMAFFIMLWLISSTTHTQRTQIADYFTPPTGLGDAEGIGKQGGTTISPDGNKKDDRNNYIIVAGSTSSGMISDNSNKKSLVQVSAENEQFENVLDKLVSNIGSDPDMLQFKDNIDGKISPDGLQIDVTDSRTHFIYDPTTGKLTPFGEAALIKIADVLKGLRNHIFIIGRSNETESVASKEHTKWDLSVDYANFARRAMEGRLAPDTIMRIIGAADKDPLLPSVPSALKNRGVTILAVRGSYVLSHENKEKIRDALSVPKPADDTAPVPTLP